MVAYLCHVFEADMCHAGYYYSIVFMEIPSFKFPVMFYQVLSIL